MKKQKQAVIYGAGNIGRGFIGQLFYEAGYETAFIDIDKDLINMLNEKKEYPINFVDNNSSHEIMIKNARGIDGSPENSDEIADAISKADIMAVSVGANILKFIMEPIAGGINKRFADGNLAPLNIIMCENLIGADKVMRDGVGAIVLDRPQYEEKIGFIQASVARMVPTQTDETKGGNPLRIVSEDYKYLYIDKDEIKGEFPEIKNIIAYSPFQYYIERKLYINNMGHAVCAYLGDISGYEYIWQAIQDPHIKEITEKAMQYSGMALEKKYKNIGFDYSYTDDLIHRFENKALGDTVARVGADLKRKLAMGDRITGVLRLMITYSLPVKYMCLTIAAATNFKSDKLSGQSLEEILKEAGSYDYISGNPEALSLITQMDKGIKSGMNIKELLEKFL